MIEDETESPQAEEVAPDPKAATRDDVLAAIDAWVGDVCVSLPDMPTEMYTRFVAMRDNLKHRVSAILNR